MVFRSYSWLCAHYWQAWDHMRCRASNPGRPRARQTPYCCAITPAPTLLYIFKERYGNHTFICYNMKSLNKPYIHLKPKDLRVNDIAQ